MKTGLLKSERGSFVVETAISLLVVITMVSGGLIAVYTSFVYVWIDHASYETLVCLSTKASEGECASELQTRVKLALPFGEVSQLHVSRNQNEARVQLHFNYKNHLLLKHNDSRRLPLDPGARL
jgi:hypothetical protein